MVEELASSRELNPSDKSHLKVLSVLHFVGAGLAALGIVFVGLHFLLFRTVVMNPAFQGPPGSTPPPAEIFDFLQWIYVVLGLWYGTSLVMNLLAGSYLNARKHRTFCFVTAAINCLHMPLGTVLGIFTIIVLARDAVRVAFAPRTPDVDRLA